MNYEERYQELQPIVKQLKEAAAAGQKGYKSAAKDIDKGDIRDLAKQMAALEEAAQKQLDAVRQLKASMEGFDTAKYFEDGDFTRQMLECAEKSGVDVAGDNPVFEMFPYKVRIDAANQDVFLNRKRLSSIRPQAVINMVSEEQQKLNKAGFNAESFAAELENGYELAILKGKKRPNAVLLLNNVYKVMVPMARSKKEYDMMAFAYDLARLYNSPTRQTKGGRAFELGTSRDGKTGIRILDSAGHEQFVSTVKFFDAES